MIRQHTAKISMSSAEELGRELSRIARNGWGVWSLREPNVRVRVECPEKADGTLFLQITTGEDEEPKPLSDGRILVDVGPSQWCEKEPKP